MTVVAVIGPSGCGKSSLVRELQRRGLVQVHPTWTTRPRRADELTGSLEHRFVTDEVFDELCAQEFFLATATLFGLPWRYGLPPVRSGAGERVDLVMLRAPVVDRVRALLGLSLVIQIEDGPDRIARRLLTRGSDADEVRARIQDNRSEVASGRIVADVTLHNDGTIDQLADHAAAAIRTYISVAGVTR